MLAGIAVLWFAVDQLLKQLVVSTMTEHQRIEVIGEALQWVYVRNPGAAFSIASGQTWIMTLVASAVVVAVAILARRIRSRLWAVVFGMVLGGALGNLFDRLFREPGFFQGEVVDYIYTPWMMPAIYNFADIGVVVGMIAFVLLTLFDVQLDGTRLRRGRKDAEEEASA